MSDYKNSYLLTARRKVPAFNVYPDLWRYKRRVASRPIFELSGDWLLIDFFGDRRRRGWDCFSQLVFLHRADSVADLVQDFLKTVL